MFSKKPKTIDPKQVDPSVYYYDEVYDEMKEEQEPAKKEKSKEGSKYMEGLLKTAELRKNGNELRKFKKYTKERESAQESNEEIYFTSAYKKKLKLLEEKGLETNVETKKECKSESFVRELSPKRETNPGTSSQTRDNEEPSSSKKPLKTFSERKEFLRTLLSKKTVGKVYDEALKRYIERKALKSNMTANG